jgi:hypothetical protein
MAHHQLALIQSSLARFDKNKDKLLQRLLDGRTREARKIIYNPTESWAILRRVAKGYLEFEQVRKSAPSEAQTKSDLETLKKNLSAARELLRKYDVENELIRALFRARYRQPPLAVLKADSFVANKMQTELTEAATHVWKLEMAASKAAANARRKPGRPNSGSTVLPSDYIVRLAKLYRGATGRVPGAGEGPFGFFIVEFLNAIERGNLTPRSIFNLSIRARRESLAADANSPFKR